MLEVDPASGNRKLISGGGVGSGPSFVSPLGMAFDTSNDILVSHNAQNILLVNSVTGNRSIVSGGTIGSGVAFTDLRRIARELSGQLLAVDEDLDAVIRVNSQAGLRTIFSDARHGLGPVFQTPEAIATVVHLVPEPQPIRQFAALVFAALACRLTPFGRWVIVA